MSIKHIFFASRLQAESLRGSATTAVISIKDPDTEDARLSSHFKYVLRMSFYDAVPADEFLPAPMPGLFDHIMAREISDFIALLQSAREDITVMVHCEYGVSRSAAVALFVEAYTGVPLTAREFAYDANPWVVDRLLLENDHLQIEIPVKDPALERRTQQRAA